MNIDEIRHVLRTKLAHLLQSAPGSKDLVIGSNLTKALDRIAGVSFLKSHDVDKIFILDPVQKSLPGGSSRFYFVRSEMRTVKCIADHINADLSQGIKRSNTIIFVPRKLHVCEMILEHEGVFGQITIEEFPLDLIPLDRDLMSMEMPEFFGSFYQDSDETWLHTVSSSLVNFQTLFGRIPNVYCIGGGAKMVHHLMKTLQGLTGEDVHPGEVGNLVIIDRDVDMVSPLCSPVTYEALLDETFSINCSFIEFGSEVVGKDQSVKKLLTSHDEIYEQIRNRHFSNVFGYLSNKAKELQVGYDKKNSLKTVGDMKDFVANDLKGLKQQHKALSYHIGACEVIMKRKAKMDFEEHIKVEHSLLEGTDLKESITYVEECINKQASMVPLLKLMCLLSLTQDGLSSSTYRSLKTQFLQSYGFEHLLSFFNLKKLGLLVEQDLMTPGKPLAKGLAAITRRSNFMSLSKKLSLVPKSADEVNLKSPNDMSYVFSGAYTPLSCKLVEQVLTREGFAGLDDVTKHIPGGTFANVEVKRPPISKGRINAPMKPALKTVLVYFLGGCTFSEIAALRYLARTEAGWKIIIATTAIVTGNSLIESVVEKC
ncbi:vacuolar protein sorting-associated protein 33B-like [Gigantopelta aegis]|uniref:vacuolar protein sorting-associated protein 33B-like n=1 Tax=Gigantopelta aegis TaxID=1735272 RepID=UPI001B88C0A8|nr:vacuolar protein sorting-associated protein 33B-like [Gigantopelta aegis]